MSEPTNGAAPRLPDSTLLGAVYLRVRDLPATTGFYREVLGLEVRAERDGGVMLGTPTRDLVGLIAAPEGASAPRAPGLYHLALLLPDRAALGRFLKQAVRTRAKLQGASDHGVSEAVYLSDPEGNGVEVYRDRPRDEWPLTDTGVDMFTSPLDGRSVIDAGGLPSEPFRAPPGTLLGHVHLQVSDLERARRRYVDVMGFQVTQSDYEGALFAAASGYHHHVGMNVWRSAGQPPAPAGSLGLAWFEVEVPGAEPRAALLERLAADGPATEHEGPFPATLYPDADGIAVAVTGG